MPAEATSRYNELIARADNPADETELLALFPSLKWRISTDLKPARSTTGKGEGKR